MTLGHHHKPFGSARIARAPPCPRVGRSLPTPRGARPRWQRQHESRRGWAIHTRLAPGACSEVPKRPGINTTISQRQPCGPGTVHRPVGTELCYGGLGGGLRDGVAVLPRHWHPTAMPPALNRATQAPRERSARAPLDLVQGGGWLPPPTRSNASHMHTTLKPSALGEPGWASRVAGASRICTNPSGTRFCHFGAAMEISR